MPIKKRTNPQTGEVEEYDSITGEVFREGVWVKPEGASGGGDAGAPKPPVRFNMGTGVMPSPEIAQSERASSAAVGAISGFPNPYAMGVGGVVGAALPTKSPATEIGQGWGQSAGMALLNRLLPGAGFLPRALVSAAGVAGGGAVGTQIDAARGNETQTQGTQEFAAILSGLLAGRGPKAPFLTGPAGESALVNRLASDTSSPLARAVNSRFFRGFIRGNKKFAQDTLTGVDQVIDETFEPIGQTDILRILGQTEKAVNNPNSAAFKSTLEALKTSQDPTRASETILRTYFGSEPTQALASATFLREILSPEDYQKISNAWLTHVFFRDALVEMGGLEGKGSKMLQDIGEEAPGRGSIPYVLRTESGETALPYAAARGGPDFVLSGEKILRASERYGKKNLETIVGPKAYEVLQDVGHVLNLLAFDKPKDSWRNSISEGLRGTLRYQGNRFFYIASGVGSALGAGALAGVLPAASVALGLGGTAIGLDYVVQKGLLNPKLMEGLRKATEAGDGRGVSTAFRALMSAEATMPESPPTSK